jgi:hypothetical protein
MHEEFAAKVAPLGGFRCETCVVTLTLAQVPLADCSSRALQLSY